MTTDEIAQLFDGIIAGLGDGLKEPAKKGMGTLVGLLRRFPKQGIGEFVKLVEGALSKDKNSLPAIAERVRSYQAGGGEPRQELLTSAKTLGAPELKKLLASLGIKPANKKDDNLKLFESHLAGGQSPTTSPTEINLSHDIDRAAAAYDAIKAALRDLSIADIRAKFAAVSAFPRPVLAGLLERLGYPADGRKDELEAKLLDNLTSLKISQDQTRQIG